MPSFDDIRFKLIPLIRILALAVQRVEEAQTGPNASDKLMESLTVEASALFSKSLFGSRTIGKQFAKAKTLEAKEARRKSAEGAIRTELMQTLAEIDSILSLDISEVPARVVSGWREHFSRLRVNRHTGTAALLRQAEKKLVAIQSFVVPKTRRTPRNRDDFTPSVKRSLAIRVGYRCSNPWCHQQTAGPSSEGQAKSTIVGDAAHIAAAAPGGPRFDPALSSEQRKSASNGIWLCAKCARMIDRDVVKYTSSLLRNWKHETEERARAEVEGRCR